MTVRRGTTGFTLLELIVAMGLMVVVSAALYASLSAAFRGRRVAEDTVEPVRKASGALSLMADKIETACAPTGILAGTFIGTNGTGDDGEASDVLSFYSMARASANQTPASPIVQIEFALVEPEEKAEDGWLLVRRTVSNLLAPEAQTPVEEVLCRNVRSFDLIYFDGTDWLDGWDSTSAEDALPLAVKATLEFQDARGKTLVYSEVIDVPCGSRPSEGGGTRS